MLRQFFSKRLASALVAAGVFAIAQFGAPGLATAAPYPPSVVTSTDLTLQHDTVQEGQSNKAYAKVSSGSGTPTGTVTFTVAGHQSTVALKPNGTATFNMPTDLAPGKTYKVAAHYNGDGVYKESSDTAYVTVEKKRGNGQVKGSEGSQSGNNGGAGGTGENGGGKGRTAPTTGIVGEDTSGGLPGVGSDSGTMLYGLGGLVLLGAGGFALALNRRRSHA